MRTPTFWYRPRGLTAQLLRPLSWLYGLGRALDGVFSKPKKFQRPVICVGNLVAGGAGKTPVVLALAALLQRQGVALQIITRGFGGSATGPQRVDAADEAAMVGDEALLLAAQAPTIVARDRAAGIAAAFAAGAPLVVLDDGLQSVKLRARVNLLVIDGASGFGNGLQLPAGPLRESVAVVAARIQGIVMIGADRHNCAAQFSGLPMFHAEAQYDLSQLDRRTRYLAFAGLARPDKFFDGARAQALQMVETVPFADHHPYSRAECEALQLRANGLQAKLLTTAKDAVRWPDDLRGSLAILPLTLRFTDEAAVLAFLQRTCPEPFNAA